MKKLIYITGMFLIAVAANAQTGIGTGSTTPAATLDVTGKPTVTTAMDGILAPRITAAQLSAKNYGTSQDGAMVYVTDVTVVGTGQASNVDAIGLYVYSKAPVDKWVKVTPAAAAAAWALLGNAGTTAGTNFVGTTDDIDLVFKRKSVEAGWLSEGSFKRNTSFGVSSMSKSTITTGTNNVAVGNSALQFNSTGSQNVALGTGALVSGTSPTDDIAIGDQALAGNSGSHNIGMGASTLARSSTDSGNVAIGFNVLSNHTAGNNNTAIGVTALLANGTGASNTVIGAAAGQTATGSNNIIIGASQDVAVVGNDNQLNIGGAIFGTGLSGNATTPAAAGKIGINTTAPGNTLEINQGTLGNSGLRLTKLTNATTTATAGAATLGVNASGDVVITSNAASTAAKNFIYMPSIAIDVSTAGGPITKDLYALYTAQFTTPQVASTGAPAAIPVFAAATDLYYYVTYYDTNVFSAVSVDASGVLSYTVSGTSTNASFINIVLVPKN